VLAMKTKENAFTLPVMITLYEFCFFSRFTSHVSRFLYLVPILLTLLIVPLTLMGLAGSHQLDPGSYGAKVFPRNEYLFTQFRVIVTYLRLLFFPVDQNLDYDYPLFKSFFIPQVILSFLFLASLFGLGVYLVIKTKNNSKENDSGQAGMTKKERGPRHSGLSGIASRFTVHDSRSLRLIGFGILWFFITLSVESSVIPLPMLIDEYRMYLPSVGLIISSVTSFFLLERFLLSRFTIHVSRFTVVSLVVAVGVLSVATHLRNDVWADNVKLWQDTAEKSPGKATVHLALGNIYQAHTMFDKALEQYMISIKLKPDYADAYNNLGNIYKFLNMPVKAMEQYLFAIELKPDFAEAHNNLGIIYKTLNMPDKALSEFQTVINLRPDVAEAHNNLGNVYLSFNMPDKAGDQYLIAIKLKPDYAMAYFNLGFLYYRMGQKEMARTELTEGLRIKPNDQNARQLLEAVNSEP